MSNWFFRYSATTALCVLVGFAAGPVRAQTTANQPTQPFTGELTVTATGVETEVNEVPAAVTVITREEMDDAQAGTVVEMLRRVPGLSVVGSGNEGKLVSVFTRGTNSNQTLVMFDGIRLNSPYFGGFDWSRLNTAGLRQVEVARGPYSALWGADAVGGVINLLPRRGQIGWDGRLLGEGGKNGRLRLEADIAWGSRTFDFYVSGSDIQGDGEIENSDFDNRQILLTAGWKWGQGSRLGVLVQNQKSETGIPYATPGSPTPERRQEGEQSLLAVPFTLQIGKKWTLNMSAATIDGEFFFRDPEDLYFTFSETETTSTQARLSSHHKLGGHTLSWGGEWREDEVTDASNYGTNLESETTTVTSVFLQDSWRLSSKFRVLVGARWDDAEEWGSEASPRIDFGWRLSKSFEVRAGYGKAFRPPSLGELYYPFSGNSDLVAETSSSSELGFVYSPRNGKSRWQLTAFSSDLDNLIEFDFSTYSNQNIASAKISGAELGWDRSVGKRSHTFIQFTYLNTEDDLGQPLLRRPEWSGSWTFHGSWSEYVKGDITLIWVGSREDVDPITYDRTKADGYFTTNISFAYSLWEGVDATIRVLNLGNEEYTEVLGYPAPGRRYMFGIRIGRF